MVISQPLGFDWDTANVNHILRHGVVPEEVEEAAGNLFGKTVAGRYLVVVFTVRRKLLRAVTAYDMSTGDRTIYAPKID